MVEYKNIMVKRYDHFINGQWVSPNNGEYLESTDPALNQVWAEFARGNAADADVAVKAAQQAFTTGPWGQYDASQRATALIDLADNL